MNSSTVNQNSTIPRPTLPLDINTVKGFLAEDEAQALYECALEMSEKAAVLEIGSYCGKSTIYLGLAAQKNNGVVYAVDHHRGSEEHQKGEMFHDSELFDAEANAFDSFKEFRKNISRAGLNDTVVPLVNASDVASRCWNTPLGLVFIDGGHSLDAALLDYRCWAGHIIQGGILCIHDLYPNAETGGQAPWAVYKLALASGLFKEIKRVNSLGVLRRI